MIIILKIYLFLLAALKGYAGFFIVKDWYKTYKNVNFKKLMPIERIKINLVTFAIVSSILCAIIFLISILFTPMNT